MVGQSKKPYLHRTIKILNFLASTRIQKYLTALQNILDFLTTNHLQAESRLQEAIFLHVIPVRIYLSLLFVLYFRVIS